MATTKHKTDAQTIEAYRVALANAVNQSEVAATLAEFGYTAAEIANGTKLLVATSDAFGVNKTEDNETIVVRAAFDNKKALVADMYTLDRKKAKVVFRNDEVVLKQLGLKGSVPQAYVKWT